MAAGWMVKLLDTREDPNTHVLIRGPQGCGKSMKVMRIIPMIYERDPGVIFFSSPSIAHLF
jgi:ABC-type iron transport system FetAB ATPase subunit